MQTSQNPIQYTLVFVCFFFIVFYQCVLFELLCLLSRSSEMYIYIVGSSLCFNLYLLSYSVCFLSVMLFVTFFVVAILRERTRSLRWVSIKNKFLFDIYIYIQKLLHEIYQISPDN